MFSLLEMPIVLQNILIFTIIICWINLITLSTYFRYKFIFGLMVFFPLIHTIIIPFIQNRVIGLIIAILNICYILYLFFLNYKYMKDNYKKERLGFIILSSIVIIALASYFYENNNF